MKRYVALVAFVVTGCTGDDEPPPCSADSDRVLVTADWLNRSLHDPASGFAFLPQPNDSLLTIVDLATQTTRNITWLSDVGPTYAALYSPK